MMTSSSTAFSSANLSRRVAIPLLLAIMLVGFALRVWNINFDRGIGSHPDERSTACFYAPSIHLPKSWDEFWDPHRSPLNPLWDLNQQQRRSFTYGHFPLYLGVAASQLMHQLAPAAAALQAPTDTVQLMARADTSCDAIAVAGRLVIALFDTLTILLLYLLAGRMAGRAGGLLAAAFYAFAAQAVQLSHFFAMDPASTTFTVLAVLGGVLMVDDRRLRVAVLTGIGIGLAVASKFSALPLLAAPVVASLLSAWRELQRSQEEGRPYDGRIAFRALVGVLTAWVIAYVAFFVTSPYAVLDWGSFSQAVLVEQGMMIRGVADMPFTRQYRNTTPYLYFIQQQLQWGLGWPLGLVAAAGAIFALAAAFISLYRLVAGLVARQRGRSIQRWVSAAGLANLVVWSWVAPYFGLTGAFLAKFNRYMIPLLPFVLLWGAWLIVALWRWAPARRSLPAATGELEAATEIVPPPAAVAAQSDSRQRFQRWRAFSRGAAVLLAVLGVAGGLFWSAAYVNGVYNREHTWITASRWIYENAPSGSKILWELWDDPLPKTIPGEPGMDMGSKGLSNIDWSPYEEDTADKYAILKQKLREADYVAYSSKRIYDSVDELPQRYPMTNLYYQAMRDGRLGYELAAEFTSPPRLLGFTFDDRHADESWSLYDHPQVSIYRKVRDLTDAEFDAVFQGAWEKAVPNYRGPDSPLSPFLNAIGLGSAPGTENSGLINRIINIFSRTPQSPVPPADQRRSLMLPEPLRDLPLVDNYRWNTTASASTPLAVLWWWAVVALLGWLVWPVAFVIFRPLRDRGYFLSRTLGWLLAGWLLWMLVNAGVFKNFVSHAWLTVAMVAVIGAAFAVMQRRALWEYVKRNWAVLLAGEGVFAAAYLFFIYIRMRNPDLWQPWFGGEKQMEFAFLNGILRSPTFPPVDPHFAGGFINYYYFGIYLVAYLIKLTGIYAEVAFNLTIATLFALTVINVFAVAYSAGKRPRGGGRRADLPWHAGFAVALLAPLFVVIIGNLDGCAELVRELSKLEPTAFQSALPGLKPSIDAVAGLRQVLTHQAEMPKYDFWGPSRVITPTINEFPYWSFLFADMHPHIMGIPLAGMFLALILVIIEDAGTNWRRNWRYGLGLLATFALFLGALASVNLWELPTYLGLGVLAFLVSQFRGEGRIRWGLTLAVAAVYAAGAYLLFLPFFRSYVNVGASGLGLLREPDPPQQWLLVWGFLGFLALSWILFAAARPARSLPADADQGRVRPSGIERMVSLCTRRFDQLPQAIYLHQKLVRRPGFFYLLFLAFIPTTAVLALIMLLTGWTVLAVCLLPLGLAFALLWRRGRAADAGSLFASVLAATGLALLAGTQIFYLRDFMDGSEYYRMNTLFKFFNQVWLLWAVAGAIAVPRLVQEWVGGEGRGARSEERGTRGEEAQASGEGRETTGRGNSALQYAARGAWVVVFVVLLGASLAYPVLGTPARLDQRMPTWRPPEGTLNGLDFMREGVYAWPDFNNIIELKYEWEGLQWVLDHIRGNATIAESSETDYYRAWGTRIASNSGLSGLKGAHEQEQRYPEDVGERDGLHHELWATADIPRTQQLLDQLNVDHVYVGQLERFLHPEGVQKFAQMAQQGMLTPLYQNERVIIYAVKGRLQQQPDGAYAPAPSAAPAGG